MSMKQSFFEIISRYSFFGKIISRLRNHLRLHGNRCEMSNIHCRKNQINLSGKQQSLTCHTSSYIRDGKVHIEGDYNVFEIAENSAIYGEREKTVYVCGNNNYIVVGKGCTLRKVSFFIRGDGNAIFVGDNCSAYNVNFHIEQSGNEIRIGHGTTFHGRDEQAVRLITDEGSKILIGEDCMFAHSTEVRSTDSHSILDLQGNRLNPAKNIVIGNHCWIGLQCIILKGTEVPHNCMIAAGSVCSKKYDASNCILAGNPARVVKRDIDWNRKFI